jgi:chaperone required for assembly of F1-ATPase
MKRFYKEVSVAARDSGYVVLLGGRPVRTPGRNLLILPTQALAAAIAAEWRGQGADIIATSMPLLRLANTVVDGVAANRAEVVAAVLRFGESDLLCYRTHQPPELVARQSAGWDPLLDWVRQRHSVRLRVAEGLGPVEQSDDALLALREAIEVHDPFALGALHMIASITGSAVLALAVAEGVVSGPCAFDLSRIDEIYQAEKWGEDAEAIKRAGNLAHELNKAAELLALSGA